MPRIRTDIHVGDDGKLKRSSQTTAFGTAGVAVTAVPTRVYRVRFLNKAAANKYFCQIHNKATAAVNTEVPIWEGQCAAGTDLVLDFGSDGLWLPVGLSLALSTTGGVLTLAGAADAFAYVHYAS